MSRKGEKGSLVFHADTITRTETDKGKRAVFTAAWATTRATGLGSQRQDPGQLFGVCSPGLAAILSDRLYGLSFWPCTRGAFKHTRGVISRNRRD